MAAAVDSWAKDAPPKASSAEGGNRDKLQLLIDQVLNERQGLLESSTELFRAQQDFLKKYEDLRILRQEGKDNLRTYADNLRQIAVKQAEVAYYQEEATSADIARTHAQADKQRLVNEERAQLVRALEQYRQNRNKIGKLQRLVMTDTSQVRHRTEEIAEALAYAKSVLESELRRPSHRKSFPTKKEVSRTQRQLLQSLSKATDEMKSYHMGKILEFRRQERILLGRTKDATDASGQRKPDDIPIVPSLSQHHHTNEAHDSLENRIAQRMFAQPDQEDPDRYNDSEPDDVIGLPVIDAPAGIASGQRPRSLGSRAARRFSILQNGEVERLQNKWSTPQKQSPSGNASHSSGGATLSAAQWGQKKLMGGNGKTDVVYDPDVYVPYCAGDFIRPHLLVDLQPHSGDKEDRAVRLASMLCHAKGKVIQMNAIKEGLDVLLLKHAALLLGFLEQLNAGGVIQGDARSVAGKSRGQRTGSIVPTDIYLAPHNKVNLAEVSRKEREMAFWRQKLYSAVFPETSRDSGRPLTTS